MALLNASGPSVGLPKGYMGNSEVGHLTLGSGRVVDSILKKFHDAIDDESFFENKLLIERFLSLKASGGALHLMGLLSDAGVHSHIRHLFALLKLAKKVGLESVFIHVFLDGRDAPPKSAGMYLTALQQEIDALGCGVIASVTGRLYAMDRDTNWDRTFSTYAMLCGHGKDTLRSSSWQSVLDTSYQNNVTDEFIEPHVLNPAGLIKSGDGVVFFNFRPDRACQLAEAFINPQFSHFKNALNTGNKTLAFFITTTRYKAQFNLFNNDILFERTKITHTLLDEIALQIKPKAPHVFIIAETEKYAHVTYFFRGMEDKQLQNETRKLIPSIKIHSYATHPEMSAQQITDTLVSSLRSKPAYFYLVNYANADMVGHSGDFKATVTACEFIDQQLAVLYDEVVTRLGGTLIVTADHGNAEKKIDAQGNPLTAHTDNPVPFVLACSKHDHPSSSLDTLGIGTRNHSLGLANGAATILKCLGLNVPSAMNQEIIF